MPKPTEKCAMCGKPTEGGLCDACYELEMSIYDFEDDSTIVYNSNEEQ